MLAKILSRIKTSAFLRDSGFLFFVNITVAVINYSLILLAGRMLGNQFELWNTLNSLIAVLSAPLSGINTEVIKKTATLKEENLGHVFDYYYFMRRRLAQLSLIFLLLLPLSVWALSNILKIQDLLLLSLTLLHIGLVLVFGLNSNLLLGLLRIKKFAASQLFNSLMRLSLTLLFLFLGLQTLALPLGLVITSSLGFILTEILIKREETKISPPSATEETVQNLEVLVEDTPYLLSDVHLPPKNKQNLSQKPVVIKERPPELQFSFREEILNIGQTSLITFFLTTFLNLTSTFSRNFFAPQSSQADLFATIFVFGNIVFFGTSALLGGLVPHSTGKNHRQIYLTSVIVAFGLSVLAGFLFLPLGPILLGLLKKPQFISAVPLISLYCLFIACYVIISISIQYLISRSQYKLALWIIPFSLLLGLSLFFAEKISLSQQNLLPPFLAALDAQVFSIVSLNIFFAAATAAFFFFSILARQKQNSI